MSRGLARSFRALARKCVSGRPRGPAPAVVVEVRAGTLTVWVKTDDAGLVYSAPTERGDEVMVIPMEVLDVVEGSGNDPVELSVNAKLRDEAKFTDRGVPRTHSFDAILPGKQHPIPDPPDNWYPVPPDFLAAVHECGRTTARESGRFALTRVQIRGKAGQVIATDSRSALVWAGFRFPFAEDVLVPALPVFGTRELTTSATVRLGRTASHLVVAVGSWQVVLPFDTAGRYPDIAAIVTRNAPTTAGISDQDATELIGRLPGLPGADTEHRPVTLELDDGVVVRARDETDKVEEVRLERSSCKGPRMRVAIDRRVLARALALGCLTLRLTADKPVVFEGDDKILIAVALHPTLAVAAETDIPITVPERRRTVKHETNGHAPDGRPDPIVADSLDPLAAAEDLRNALADAMAKAGRLVAALKSRKKEQRALTQVWSSLKALNLGPEGRP
jgi:hypothetical protein